MAKSELIEKIRDAFIDQNLGTDVTLIGQFCDYFTRWLTEHPFVGVGHTPDGMSLRMADGKEIGLLALDIQPSVADTPAVSLTTSGASARQGISGEAPSVQITGR